MPGNDQKNVTINKMPSRIRNDLAKKAKEDGRSLSNYLLMHIIELHKKVMEK